MKCGIVFFSCLYYKKNVLLLIQLAKNFSSSDMYDGTRQVGRVLEAIALLLYRTVYYYVMFSTNWKNNLSSIKDNVSKRKTISYGTSQNVGSQSRYAVLLLETTTLCFSQFIMKM